MPKSGSPWVNASWIRRELRREHSKKSDEL
jgi:hypothetical protein